ncbi:MAG TPA: DUF805 domain-containing protein [Telluria sp.]|jgi:uncharacterized membrane protein YhaH (DUF805 family)
MSNLYAAPAADMASPLANNQTYMPKMFELNGRIGRVRYLVYATVISIVMMGLVGVAFGLLAKAASLMMIGILALIVWIPMVVILFFVLRRRLHDMGKSGWFALLQFVPLVNLGFILWVLFGRGNEGSNQYGLAPAPNTRPLVIAAWLIPLAIAAATPSYLKFEKEMTNKMMGTGATDAMQQDADAGAVPSEQVEGAGNDAATDAAAPAAPAEPKPAN